MSVWRFGSLCVSFFLSVCHWESLVSDSLCECVIVRVYVCWSVWVSLAVSVCLFLSESLCLCVYLCVSVCVCVCVCVCVWGCVSKSLCQPVCLCVWVCDTLCVSVFGCVSVSLSGCVSVCESLCVCVYEPVCEWVCECVLVCRYVSIWCMADDFMFREWFPSVPIAFCKINRDGPRRGVEKSDFVTFLYLSSTKIVQSFTKDLSLRLPEMDPEYIWPPPPKKKRGGGGVNLRAPLAYNQGML